MAKGIFDELADRFPERCDVRARFKCKDPCSAPVTKNLATADLHSSAAIRPHPPPYAPPVRLLIPVWRERLEGLLRFRDQAGGRNHACCHVQNASAGAVDFASTDPLTAAVRRQFALAEGHDTFSNLRAGTPLLAGETELRMDTLFDPEVSAMLRETASARACSATVRRFRTPAAGGMGPEERCRRPSRTKATGASFPTCKTTARSLRPKSRAGKGQHVATGAQDDPIGARPARSRKRLAAGPGVAVRSDKTTAWLIRFKPRALKRVRAATGAPSDPIGASFDRGRKKLGGIAPGVGRAAGPASKLSSAVV